MNTAILRTRPLLQPHALCPPRRRDRLRIGTYNILDGAGLRADGQLALLAEAGLDLLFITEAMGRDWRPGGRLRRRYERHLDMWSCGRLEPGDGDGNGRHALIFGRHGVVHPGTYKRITTRPTNYRSTGMLAFTVDGYPHQITAMADHWETLSPLIRYSGAVQTALCCLTGGPTAGPAIRGGDHNSLYARPRDLRHVAADDLEPDWEALPCERWHYHLLTGPDGEFLRHTKDGPWISDRRPSKVLVNAGFRDVVAELLKPEDRPATGGFGADDVERRLDHLNVRHLTPKESWIDTSPAGAVLSDHRFVYAEIVLQAP